LGQSVESLFHKHPVDRGIQADNAGNARFTGASCQFSLRSRTAASTCLSQSLPCKAHKTWSVDLTVGDCGFRHAGKLLQRLEIGYILF
jgi:hypothetical protein